MDIEVIVEGEGLSEVETIRIPHGVAAREIVVAVAAKGGFPAEEGILFVEDSEEPLDLALVVVEETLARKVHHVYLGHGISRLESITRAIISREDSLHLRACSAFWIGRSGLMGSRSTR